MGQPRCDQRQIRIRKTKERDAIVRSVAAQGLDRFFTKRRAEEPGGLLFVMPDGSKIKTRHIIRP
jgi:hypothetical protein